MMPRIRLLSVRRSAGGGIEVTAVLDWHGDNGASRMNVTQQKTMRFTRRLSGRACVPARADSASLPGHWTVACIALSFRLSPREWCNCTAALAPLGRNDLTSAQCRTARIWAKRIRHFVSMEEPEKPESL